MIQRIQTLYLLLVVVLGTLLCVFSPVQFLLPEATEYVSLHAMDKWPMAVMTMAVPVLALVTIFLFKRRTLQIRLCAVEMVLLLGVLILYGLYYWFTIKSFENFTLDHLQFGWAAPMPVVALILTYLASRAIFKDEMLVRSLDRIR